ncbi:GNAT family N-acetyltransferase [Aquicoccus sp. G2-2]|uniref:GNAT family N-acetyltransferase n=1 Tax=Aquicoccus sp. G2-2 TaxID=3092120 RepID=UPI002AE08598|nr:GNAT family N-acetyltransferase [Aquicoccus sp. G2-2]MEA1113419.1 GNAT family N-acetyltransferase [Aquicoccus sp. G2-2]
MQRGWKIRALAAGDAVALCHLIEALAAHHGDVAEVKSAQVMRDCLGTDAVLRTLVAQAQGKLIGYAAAMPRVQLQFGRRGAELHHLFVAREWRGRGVGRGLMRATMAMVAREMGAEFMVVGTEPENLRAQGFYTAFGLRALGGAGPRFAIRLSD